MLPEPGVEVVKEYTLPVIHTILVSLYQDKAYCDSLTDDQLNTLVAESGELWDAAGYDHILTRLSDELCNEYITKFDWAVPGSKYFCGRLNDEQFDSLIKKWSGIALGYAHIYNRMSVKQLDDCIKRYPLKQYDSFIMDKMNLYQKAWCSKH
jgi:hypothetical protein